MKSAAPDIEWRLITDLRNIVVHSYWQIDLEIIVRNRLDPLIAQLNTLIALVERTET